MKKFILSGVLFLMVFNGKAQYTVEQVADINPAGSSNPSEFVSYQGSLYFSAYLTGGSQLWKTDGTSNGTQLVKNISAAPLKDSDEPIILNNKMIIQGYELINGSELWMSDGTAAGTQLISNFNSGSTNFLFGNGVRKLNNKAVFFGDNVNGAEPWITDGTANGTNMLKNINPIGDAIPTISAQFNDYTSSKEWNGKIFFSADNGTDGLELWVTDGTSLGTQMVKDLNPTGSSSPKFFTEFQNKMYFSTNAGLWVTDGTSLGTQLIFTGTFFRKIVFNNKLYVYRIFNNGTNNQCEVFVTDGTTAGTVQITNINVNALAFYYSSEAKFTIFNNKLFLKADDGTHGLEIWTIDASNNVEFFGDLNFTDGVNDALSYFYPFDNKLFFSAQQDANGFELWYTDGTFTGTQKIAPAIAPNSNPLSFYTDFHEHNGALYFGANYTSDGTELFKVYNSSTNSIDDLAQNDDLNVYPNPTPGTVSINYKGKHSISSLHLVDLSGKSVMKIAQPTSLLEIDISYLESGYFLLTIELDNGEKMFERIVKD